MIKQRFIALGVSSVLLLTSVHVSVAQETDTGTGSTNTDAATEDSGATNNISLENIQQRAARLQWENRIKRTENFRKDILKHQASIANLRTERDSLRTQRRAKRSECKSALEKTTKISRPKVAMECYKEELEFTVSHLQKKREFIEKAAGVTEDVRWLSLTRIDLLIDALSVVIKAIESDVYEEVDELQEAKINLYENYFKPYWLTVSRFHADRMLTWVASIMMRIAETSEAGNLSEEEAEVLSEGLQCLSEEEFLLQAVLRAQDLADSRQALAQARIKLGECIDTLRSVVGVQQDLLRQQEEERLRKQQEAEAAKEAELNKLGRRLRRRLNDNYRIEGEIEETNDEPAEEEPEVESHNAAPEPEEQLSRRLLRRLRNTEHRVQPD